MKLHRRQWLVFQILHVRIRVEFSDELDELLKILAVVVLFVVVQLYRLWTRFA